MLTPDEIKTLREFTEMTQVQMAQLFRVLPAEVVAWENGTLEPDEEQMERLERLRRRDEPPEAINGRLDHRAVAS